MRIAGLIRNDVVNGYDVCVSVWVQGCPFHCDGCHNPQTWSFGLGIEVEEDEFMNKVITAIKENNIKRNLSFLGGEPLCEQNYPFVKKLITEVKKHFPDIHIYIWTGYVWENLDENQMEVVKLSDQIIDGQFILKLRDISIPFRGSTNQRIIDVNKSLESNSIITVESLS